MVARRVVAEVVAKVGEAEAVGGRVEVATAVEAMAAVVQSRPEVPGAAAVVVAVAEMVRSRAGVVRVTGARGVAKD